MNKALRGIATRWPTASALVLAACVSVGATDARADEVHAKQALMAMSEAMAAAQAISFDFDALLEVVTTEDQKIALASSGSVVLNRPDKLHAVRRGGFADVEIFFDGSTFTVFGRTANAYLQAEHAGSVDELVDTLRIEHNRPVPGADFLLSDVYGALMEDVTDVKDIGSGVIGDVECDHFAFRGSQVDWQIWVTQETAPRPCMYVITSRDVPGSPQYSLRFSNWRTGAEATSADFAFENTTGASPITGEEVAAKLADLPAHFDTGE